MDSPLSRAGWLFAATIGVLGCREPASTRPPSVAPRTASDSDAPAQRARSYSPEIEQRIARIIADLRPGTAFRGKFASPTALDARMAQFHTPGISVAVIDDYRVHWARGFGLREWGKPEPVDETTLFQAGSISKPVFAFAVMRLVQAGKIDLDEDVNIYLKSWKVPANEGWQPRITLRNLLSHSAGLTIHGFPGYRTSESIPTTVQVLDGEAPANTAGVEVNLLPGIAPKYSGGGTVVAQLLVGDVLGKPFSELMHDLVLEPVGMTASTYEQPPRPGHEQLAATAHPHLYEATPGKWHIYPEMAAAGLWTTPSDLAAFLIEVMRAIRGDDDRRLSAALANEMVTPQTAPHMGLGFFLSTEPGKAIRFGHGGVDEGFAAEIVAYKDLGRGAVVMINSNEGHRIIHELLNAIAREYGWPDFVPAGPTVVEVSAKIQRRHVGRYETEDGRALEVQQDGSKLYLVVGEQPPLELFASADNEYFARVVNVTVTFERAKGGRTKGLILRQFRTELAAKKTR